MPKAISSPPRWHESCSGNRDEARIQASGLDPDLLYSSMLPGVDLVLATEPPLYQEGVRDQEDDFLSTIDVASPLGSECLIRPIGGGL